MLKTPVEGTKLNLVDVVFCGKLPVVVVTQVGYTADDVDVSSVIAVFVAFVAVPAVAAFKFATWVVLATVNGAVPVANVEVITPVAEMVVNAPVLAVVAPTVPFILIEAVPVKFVTTPLAGVPNAGVTKVGLVDKTMLPEPVTF
jgi:hypothetical protein